MSQAIELPAPAALLSGRGWAIWCAALALLCGAVQAQTTAAEQIAGYVAQSGQPAQNARGQEFFTSKHGK